MSIDKNQALFTKGTVARITFYNASIQPIFDYCDIVWGDRGNSSLMRCLQVLQNNTACIILDLPALSSATQALNSLNWKPLSERRSHHRCIFMYKMINNRIGYDCQLTCNQDFHHYNTRSKRNVYIPQAKRRWGQWTCPSVAAKDWNSLDPSIREATIGCKTRDTLQNFGIFLMNVAPQLKKITFAKFPPAPPINVDHSFRHYGHFVSGQHCAGGRGGSFT